MERDAGFYLALGCQSRALGKHSRYRLFWIARDEGLYKPALICQQLKAMGKGGAEVQSHSKRSLKTVFIRLELAEAPVCQELPPKQKRDAESQSQACRQKTW